METMIYGFVGSAAFATCVAIVTLAFKNPSSYLKLAKLLMVCLLMALCGYAAYALGVEDGYALGVKGIQQGKQINSEEIKIASWPVFSIIAAIGVLFTLIWFPSYLGENTTQKNLE